MKYVVKKKLSTDPSDFLSDILSERGIEDIYEYLTPNSSQELNPYNLDNIEAGADMIINHVKNHSKILIIVDSDCDGFTSSAIMWNYLKERFPYIDLSFTVHDGKIHGFDDKIDWIIDNDFDLIIVPDAGSNQIEEMKMLQESGIDICCIDHHICEYEGYDCIPSNTIVINNQQSQNYANKTLCGAGMVYKFCQVMDDILGGNLASDFIDLAALGEIADVMGRAEYETNYIMTEGLKHIKNDGFKALLKIQSFSLNEKATPPYDGLTTIDISFYIAPLINAVVRVGTIEENENLFKLFTTDCSALVKRFVRGKEVVGEFEPLSEKISKMAKNCKSRQDRIRDNAYSLLTGRINENNLNENPIIVLTIEPEDKIPNTMTGVICSKLVGDYNRPILIGKVHDDFFGGSMRSKNSFKSIPNFKEYLLSTNYFNYVQGHNSAAGFNMDLKKVEDFIEYTKANLNMEDFEDCYMIDYEIDCDNHNLHDFGKTVANNMKWFGNGVAEPEIIIKNIPVKDALIMGADKKSVKINKNNVSYVRFKDENFVDGVNTYDYVDVYGTFSINEYQGQKSLQFIIKDYEFRMSSKYEF